MYDIEMERAMKDMDKNKDGSVALDEFIMNGKIDLKRHLILYVHRVLYVTSIFQNYY